MSMVANRDLRSGSEQVLRICNALKMNTYIVYSVYYTTDCVLYAVQYIPYSGGDNV